MLGKISVNTQGKVAFGKEKDNQGDVKLKAFYVNDIHAQTSKMGSLKSAADSFSKSVDKNPKVDSFKLAAGDVLIGKNNKKNSLWVDFLNNIKLDLCAIGNHEMDSDEKGFADNIKDAKYKYLATNIHVGEKSPLAERAKEGKLVKSCILDKNGHKYGFIGAMPIDIKKHISPDVKSENLKVDDFNNTVKDIQKEVNNLEKKGIDKIILLSHMGSKTEKEVAQKVSGVDIIVGGHSHDLIKGVEPGKNLVKSPKGEPVLLLMAGKNGKNFGILDATFDSKGILKTDSLKNDVRETEKYPKSIAAIELKDKHLGKAEPLGILSDLSVPNDVKRNENPLADLVADAMRKKSGAQVAIVNGQSIRGKLNSGVVTDRDLQEIITFQNKIAKVKMSEKDVIDTLNYGAKHNAFQVSGLKYTVGEDKKVKNVVLENSDGSTTKLNSEKPSPEKKFTAVYDDYLLKGGHDCTALKKPESDVLEKYNWIQKDAAIEYVKSKHFNPIDMRAQSRIKREDKADLNQNDHS